MDDLSQFKKVCKNQRLNSKQQVLLQVMSVNVNSIVGVGKKRDLEQLQNNLESDVIAIQETKLSEDGPEPADPTSLGMPIISKKSRERSGGGVMTLVTKEFHSRANDVEARIQISDEIQVACTSILDVRIYNCYRRPTTKSTKEQEDLLTFMRNEMNQHGKSKKLVFVGDFNLPGTDWRRYTSTNGAFRHMAESMAAMGLKQMVKEPTRLATNGTANILDLVLTNKPSAITNVNVVGDEIMQMSDHRPITFTITTGEKKQQKRSYERWDLQNADWDSYKSDLQNEVADGHLDYHGQGPEKFYDQMINVLWRCFKKNVQKVTRTSTGGRCKKHLTDETKDLEKEFKSRYKRYLRNGKKDPQLKTEINSISRQLKKLRNRDLKEYQEKLVNEGSSTKQNINKYLDNVLGTVQRIEKLKENGEEIKNTKKIVNLFADTYKGLFEKEETLTDAEMQEICKTRNNSTLMKDLVITEKDTLQAISNLKRGVAVGKDGILSEMLIEGKVILAKPITVMFQLFYDLGYVPDAWRSSIVSPIFKKGSRTDRQNYRPVTVVSNFMKTMEKVIASRLQEHMEKHGLWTDYQFAFRPKRSVETQLISQQRFIEAILEKRGSVAQLLIDAKKAYDKLSFKNISRALLRYGVPLTMVKWILRTLIGRRFYVKLEEFLSKPVTPTSGLLQGSSMSCVIFNIVINDVANLMEKEDQQMTGYENKALIFIFADDMKILCDISTTRGKVKMQQMCNKILKWSKENSYYIHIGKTAWLEITNNGAQSDTKFYMDGQEISKTICARDLGYEQRSDNKNTSHFEKIYHTLNVKMNQIKQVIRTRSLRVFSLIWKQYAESAIKFGFGCWGNPTKRQYERLCTLQRKFFKNVRPCKCEDHKAQIELAKNDHGLSYERIPNYVLDNIKCTKHLGPQTIRNLLVLHNTMLLRDIHYKDACITDLSAKENLIERGSSSPQGCTIALGKSVGVCRRLREVWNNLSAAEVQQAAKRIAFKEILISKHGSIRNEEFDAGKYGRHRQVSEYDTPGIQPFSRANSH